VIYLGGYSSRGGPGIGVAALRDGRLTLQATVDCPDDPTFLARRPTAAPCTPRTSWPTGW
jgi:6-phosphogluconolactonase (cycloisomerase 2 family)